ncbi:MAG: hypothetical protein IJK67_01610 [Bacilli bacterium]|nr:hypothetical protein [Bacilli bacterium]
MIEGYQNIKDYLKSNFEGFKNVVINELIAYYGEKYKDEIVSRINDTNFIFYINPKKRRIKRSHSDRRKENFDEIKENYRKTRLEAKKNGELFNLYNKKSAAARFVCPYNETDFTSMYNNGEKEIEKTIFIPLYFVNDEGIIHEMIHAVMSSPLGLIESPDYKILKYKIGLITSGDKGEDLLEECMTQIEALIIYEIIKSKGISFIDEFYPNKSFECKYDLFIPSVAKFYKDFKEDLVDARITLNLRRFINKIGKENYCKLIQLLREFEENYFDCDRGIFRELISKVINQMGDNKKLVLK